MTGTLARIANLWSPVRTEHRETTRRTGMLTRVIGGDRNEQLSTMGMVGTVFGIVDRIASAQAEIEWTLYYSSPTGNPEDRIPVTRHLAIDRWNKPNTVFDGATMVEMCQQHYELTGEARIILDIDETFGILMGMWPVRPDRIEPVPGDDTFLAGFVYTSPDGEQIPLKPHEVLSVMRPNPKDPYRGIGAIQASLTDIQSSKAAAEWNRNFFRNGAIPGGVIEVPEELDDNQFYNLLTRWRESHKGVSRAHRVGVLEQGAKFVATAYSAKDMMLTDVRAMTRDEIMAAFGISKHMLGITEDVNRANAEAGEYMFAKYISRTRARRWRGILNNFYLPLFGPTTVGMEWDFASPVPEDQETENKTRTAKANAAATLKNAGWDPDDVLEVVGLPPMRYKGGTPVPAFAQRLPGTEEPPQIDPATGEPVEDGDDA